MTYFCKYGCNTPIKFDNKRISAKGKKIPLNEDGKPHRCPKRPSSTIPCNYCTQPITFDDNRKSSSGKKIPLNLDGSNHNCPKSQFNLASSTNNNKESKKENGSQFYSK